MKTLLRPTFAKVILALVLFVLFSYLWRIIVFFTISDTFPWGFPLQFFLSWGPCPPGKNCSEGNLFYFVIDIFFWYAVSALLTLIFGRKVSQSEKSSRS